jgi:hypothetical protein
MQVAWEAVTQQPSQQQEFEATFFQLTIGAHLNKKDIIEKTLKDMPLQRQGHHG